MRRFCFLLGFLMVGIATFVITIRLVPFARFASSRAAALLFGGYPLSSPTICYFSLWRKALLMEKCVTIP